MYGSTSSTNTLTPVASAALIIISLAVTVFYIAVMWRIYTKAGKPGWAVIIPIYNQLVLLQIVGRPWWWILLYLIPIVDIVIFIIVYNDLSRSFRHGVGFTLGLIFLSLIFFPILAFGGSQYVGPAGQG